MDWEFANRTPYSRIEHGVRALHYVRNPFLLVFAGLLAFLTAPAALCQTSLNRLPIHLMGVEVGSNGRGHVQCRKGVIRPEEASIPASINTIGAELFPQIRGLSSLEWQDHDVRIVPTSTANKSSRAATFEVTYNGFSSEAQEAFQRAIDIWSTSITSSVTIKVEANWESLGSNVLGSSSPKHLDDLGTGTWYPIALANAMRERDGMPRAVDIIATFNSDFDYWYFGTDGRPPSGKFDLVSVVLHEIGHGLGFAGSMNVDNGTGTEECNGTDGHGCWAFDEYPDTPMIFDRFAEDFDAVQLINTSAYPNPSSTLGGVLEIGPVSFYGETTAAVYGGSVPLYTPGEWSAGSSFAHLDEQTFSGDPSALMTPFLSASEAVHVPGPITCALFEDLGWNVTADCYAVDLLTAPETPLLSSPIDGATGVAVPITLSWETAYSAERYDLEVSVDDSFAAPEVSVADITDTSYTLDALTTDTNYFWRVRAGNAAGYSAWSTEAVFSTASDTTALGAPDEIVEDTFALTAIYPNPSQGRVDIEVTVRTATTVQLTVYDMNGRKVALLLDEDVTAGTHTATWETTSLPSGAYLCRLDTGARSVTEKILLVR